MKTLDVDTEQETEEPKKSKADKLAGKIITHLRKLHKFPENVIKVEAINVYTTRWRVNVWTWGENNAKVEASGFVVVDLKGDVVQVY